MTEIEKLEARIKILEEKITASENKIHGEYSVLNQKIEGYADTFTVAINDIKENHNKFLNFLGLIFSALGILLVGIQIGLIFFKG